LTPKEFEVLRLIGAGILNKEIAPASACEAFF
jgi:DNA-binding CsgD family transcriptional regulator